MNTESLKSTLSELGIDDEKMDELMEKIKDFQPPNWVVETADRESMVVALQIKMNDEKDWKKRAAIAAKIVSIGLD